MKTSIRALFFSAAIATSLAASAANWNVKSTERSLETDTLNLQLPDNMTGELGVQQCDSCARVALRFSESTELRVGKSPVTLAELKQFLNTAGHSHFAMLYFDLKEPIVLRLVVTGEINRQRATP